jgi:hypothetical protein
MTFDEMTQQLDELTLDEQLRLLELLSGRIHRRLRDSRLEHLRGILASDKPAPSDDEVETAYTDYLDEKYR